MNVHLFRWSSASVCNHYVSGCAVGGHEAFLTIRQQTNLWSVKSWTGQLVDCAICRLVNLLAANF